MSRIHELNERYAACASLARNGVEVIAVGDPIGARLNLATRQLLLAARDDGPGLWDDLVGAAKALRWRLLVQPQPITLNSAVRDASDEVARQLRRLRGAVAAEALLDELAESAAEVAGCDSPVGALLVRSIEEVGPSECVVVAASSAARASLANWLGPSGVRVLTATELDRAHLDADQGYVVGPPRFFRSSVVTAPTTGSLSFLLPAWFGDRSIPRSAIAPYADGAIRIPSRIFVEGDATDPTESVPDGDDTEDELLPQPAWGTRQSASREPTSEEVAARKVLLSGNLALWLDDGDRIRALDPRQPAGERVIYVDVSAVRAGTYLLVRRGETERGALYEAALGLLERRSAAIDASQQMWKSKLRDRLYEAGYRSVVRDLRARGVKAADRARAWAEPSLVRPHSDTDFETLLLWLGLPIQPSFGHATMLRRALYQASADVREQLEDAVSAADLTALDQAGHLSLEVDTAGFRGILAARVLAISPHTEIVPRHDARVPFEDRTGQWLE